MMKNNQEYLFEKFLEDKRTYTLNQNYWNKLVLKLLKEKEQEFCPYYANQTYSNGKKMFDGNPIYSCWFKSIKRAVRIIQEEPESKELELSNWFEKTEINQKEIDELIISLELTREAKEATENLLLIWTDKNLDTKNAKKKIKKTEPNKA